MTQCGIHKRHKQPEWYVLASVHNAKLGSCPVNELDLS